MANQAPVAEIVGGVRPTEKARATRARLIETAAEAFVDDGYGATSVRGLAQRSNMTSGAIYGHFPSKANLLGEAIRQHIRQDLEQDGGRPFQEQNLAGALRQIFADHHARRSLRALLVEGAAAARVDDDVRSLLHSVVQSKHDEWAALYRETWKEEGLDPAVDAEALMLFVWSAEIGMGVLEALEIELPKPEVLATLVGRLVEALSPPAP